MSNPFATNSPPPVFGQPGSYEHDAPAGGAWQASHTVPLEDEEVRQRRMGARARPVEAPDRPLRAPAGGSGGRRRVAGGATSGSGAQGAGLLNLNKLATLLLPNCRTSPSLPHTWRPPMKASCPP